MIINPPFILGDDVSNEDRLAEKKLSSFITLRGVKKRGPILESVLTYPELFGIKNAIRQEFIRIVMSTLRKEGFTGAPTDVRAQSMLAKVLRLKAQQDDGGFF